MCGKRLRNVAGKVEIAGNQPIPRYQATFLKVETAGNQPIPRYQATFSKAFCIIFITFDLLTIYLIVQQWIILLTKSATKKQMNKSMGECNTILSAYTEYMHLS